MKRLIIAIALMCIAASMGCSDSSDSSCGDGEAINVEGTTYCVFQQEVVVENGFECPSAYPNLIEGAGVGICSGESQIDEGRINVIRDRYREQNPTYNGCQIDQNCATGELCIDGECTSEAANNVNNVNNTNNGTNNVNNTNGVACQSTNDCDGTETCFDGFCTPVCGGFAGFTCPDPPNEYCDYELGDMCGIADALGVCQPRPTVCTDIDMPVCGCDATTYSNECEAWTAGTAVMSEGPCN